jgi:hypothetical protein
VFLACYRMGIGHLPPQDFLWTFQLGSLVWRGFIGLFSIGYIGKLPARPYAEIGRWAGQGKFAGTVPASLFVLRSPEGKRSVGAQEISLIREHHTPGLGRSTAKKSAPGDCGGARAHNSVKRKVIWMLIPRFIQTGPLRPGCSDVTCENRRS